MTENLKAFRFLLVLWLLELRAVALATIIGSLALPVLLAGGLRLAHLLATPERNALIVGGSGVVAALSVALLTLPGFVARLRQRGQLGYVAALPVARGPFIFALLIAFGLLALPGVVLAPFLTSLIVPMRLFVSPLTIVLVPLMLLAFNGLGIMWGLMARTEHTAVFGGLVLYIVLLTAPVFLLISHDVPRALTWVAVLLPTGVAGDAAAGLVRDSLGSLPLDLILLGIYALLTFVAADRALPWPAGDRRITFAPRV